MVKRVEYNNNKKFRRVSYIFNAIFMPFYNFLVILKFLKENDIDLVQFIPSSPYFASQILAVKFNKKKIIVDVRDYTLICPISFTSNRKCDKNCNLCLYKKVKNKPFLLRRLFFLISFLENFLYKINISIIKNIINKYPSAHIVSVSNFVKKKLIQSSYHKNKIEVIPNISKSIKIDLKNLKRENKIIFAGRLEKSKGIWDAIKSFELINDKNLIFEILGDGSEYSNIKDYIKNKKLDNIKLIGKVSNEEVLKHYLESKIILGPSIWPEPFGRFIQEGISTRTPVIATRVGGIPEGIKDHETGLLVEPNNPKQLAKAIKELLTDKKLYDKIVKNLEKEAEKYSPEKIGKQRMKVYEELLKK